MPEHVRKTCDNSTDCDSGRCYTCALFICAVCGGAEGSLPSSCPETRMGQQIEHLVFTGRIDYRHGKWIAVLGFDEYEVDTSAAEWTITIKGSVVPVSELPA